MCVALRITYVVTIIQGVRAFHQVDCWSLTSAFSRRAFEKVVDGFAERPGPIPERPAAPEECEPSSDDTVQ